ncbi:transcriptional regulator [Methanobrevibacter ruminantium M1]|uniref:Transcriptional regulator n=1 Tax=Methanobrevibacter ruminantium (strain ATCC 35063 / DSM 1093 / JCM 13430 / OCM 146 / M1) TaxID=634498 RepID=D3E438_METRM|nr:multiprotein bridging factor aMBF1 [Methanobrevibacter ruminantium]ADC47299.1 transcriptional regulator [Methanobrevibacter ruminantium M1]
MNCEICGKEIEGKPLRTKIDGSVLLVCNDCAKFGRVQRDTPLERKFVTRDKKGRKEANAKTRPKKTYTRNEEPMDELVEDFNLVVRQAREAKGWKREELAAKIYEKASVINRIESGKILPDLKLARKLEKTLNIKLIEKYDDMDLEAYKSSSAGPNTLGSIVKIKRK